MVRIATLTVAAGMAVMIIALAVVTGFKKEVTAKLVGFGSHVRIVSLHSNGSLETDPVSVDTALMESVSRLPLFASITPFAVHRGTQTCFPLSRASSIIGRVSISPSMPT